MVEELGNARPPEKKQRMLNFALRDFQTNTVSIQLPPLYYYALKMTHLQNNIDIPLFMHTHIPNELTADVPMQFKQPLTIWDINIYACMFSVTTIFTAVTIISLPLGGIANASTPS